LLFLSKRGIFILVKRAWEGLKMKRKILVLAIVISGFLITNIMAEEIKLRPIDFSHPAVKMAIAVQKTLGTNELELLWKQLSKKAQEILGPSGFRDLHLSPEGKNRGVLISKAELTGIRVITDNRIWIEARARDLPTFKGFYALKEEGVWKFGRINLYLRKVESDLNSLSNSISEYYQKNKKLPQSLSELSIDIPADLFSGSDAPYKYKVINNSTCIVYSLGPDSDDDKGLVEYSRKNHLISDGDIVKKVAF